ncbi:hypothetical protein JOM56_008023 [Amanita muscaria]
MGGQNIEPLDCGSTLRKLTRKKSSVRSTLPHPNGTGYRITVTVTASNIPKYKNKKRRSHHIALPNMSTFNPFRANPLSPTSTGASVNTVTSYNPPPSFHSVARDDEMTVFFDDVAELPVISEEAEVRGETGTGTIDLEISLPPTSTLSPTTPEIRIQVEEPALPPLPLSLRSTGSGTRNRAADDNVDFPVPEYLDDLPPAYTLAPDFNHGEATLELGPRRPFQQPPRTPHQSAPSPASTLAAQGNNTPPLSPLLPRGHSHPDRRRHQIIDQIEQVSNSSGVGNLLSGAGTGASSGTVTNRRPPQGQAQEILRHARLFSGVESRATVTNSRPSQGQAQEILKHARLFSGVGSRTGGTTGRGGRLSPFQPPLPPRLSPNPTGGSTHSANARSSAPASTTSNANSSQTPSIPSDANSGFARDFYAAGTGQGLHLSDDEDDDNVPLECAGLGVVMPIEPSGSGSNGSNGGTDDNRPTARHVPGHALLKDGKILVYPKGFTCPICFNIGYKCSDPKHPCKKCWKKYAKPYSPVMSYASDAGSLTTLQRPLPKPNSTPSSLSVPGEGIRREI